MTTDMDSDDFQAELTELTSRALRELPAATVLGVLITHVRVVVAMRFEDDGESETDADSGPGPGPGHGAETDDGDTNPFRVEDDLR